MRFCGVKFCFNKTDQVFVLLNSSFQFLRIQVCVLWNSSLGFVEFKFASKESSLPFKRIKLHRMNQVFVTSCELRPSHVFQASFRFSRCFLPALKLKRL